MYRQKDGSTKIGNKTANPYKYKLESAQGWIAQPAAGGMGRRGRQKAPDRHPGPDGQTDMPEWVQPPR